MNKVPVILGVLFLALMCLAIYLMGSSRRARRRGSTGGRNLGWALLFLASGRMPPPPPATQIEAENNTKKDRNTATKLGPGE